MAAGLISLEDEVVVNGGVVVTVEVVLSGELTGVLVESTVVEED